MNAKSLLMEKRKKEEGKKKNLTQALTLFQDLTTFSGALCDLKRREKAHEGQTGQVAQVFRRRLTFQQRGANEGTLPRRVLGSSGGCREPLSSALEVRLAESRCRGPSCSRAAALQGWCEAATWKLSPRISFKYQLMDMWRAFVVDICCFRTSF